MAEATEVEIANALKRTLNDPGRNWAIAFTAQRVWLPVYQSSDVGSLKVSIYPTTLEVEKGSTQKKQSLYGMEIEFQRSIVDEATSTLDEALMDSLSKLVESVFDYFSDQPRLIVLGTADEFKVAETNRPDIYDQDYLYNNGIWASTIELVVRAYRARKL